MSLSASSTDIESSMVSERGTNTVNPDAMFARIRHEHRHEVLARERLDLGDCLRRLKADPVDAFARILDQQHFLERVAAQHDRGEALHCAVNGAHERDAAERRLVPDDELAAEQIRREHAGQEQHDQREDRAEARNPEAEQRLGPVGDGHEEQEPVHEIEQDLEDEDRGADRQPDQQPRREETT